MKPRKRMNKPWITEHSKRMNKPWITEATQKVVEGQKGTQSK